MQNYWMPIDEEPERLVIINIKDWKWEEIQEEMDENDIEDWDDWEEI
jgi:hypothetical protein